MKFRKKPVVIDATQWFKNGDHPDDACKMVYPSPGSTTQFAPFLSEGRVVRYYRTPDLDGNKVCGQCGNVMHDHGWIDTLEGGHIVCPGDWIITGVKGERYPCKSDIFATTYEPADTEHEPTEAQIKARDALLDFIGENGTASEGVQHYLDRYVRAALAAQRVEKLAPVAPSKE